MTNLNTLNDETESADTPAEGVRLEIAPSSGLKELLAGFTALQEAIMRNAPVKRKDVKALGKSLDELKFVIGNEAFTAKEMQTNPGIKRSLEIWKEVEGGNFKSVGDLIYLSDIVAAILGEKFQNYSARMFLAKLISLNDSQAASLSLFNGDSLIFNTLTHLSDNQVTNLAQSKAKQLEFRSLATMTDNQAIALAQFRGEKLTFYGLKSLTNNQVAALVKFQGRKLHIGGLHAITDSQAVSFGQFTGEILHLGDLKILTSTQATSLTKFSGKIYCGHLCNLDRATLQILHTIKDRFTCIQLTKEIEEAGPPSSAS